MIILDIMKVLHNPYFQVADIEKLRELVRKTEKQFGDKTIFLIADMSVFCHLRKASELLEYEKTLHKDLKIERWKELCLYHKRDFETMFTEDESDKLMEYHKDKITNGLNIQFMLARLIIQDINTTHLEHCGIELSQKSIGITESRRLCELQYN